MDEIFHRIGMRRTGEELPGPDSYWIRRGGRERVVPIGEPDLPVRKGFATLAAGGDRKTWDDHEISVAIGLARRLAPRSTVVIAPVLASPEPLAGGNFREDHDGRLLDVPEPEGWFRIYGGYQPEIDALWVSTTTSVDPTGILLQASWRAAEAYALNDGELDEVAACFLESKDALGAIQHDGWSRRDLEAVCAGDSVSNWAAILFMRWYGIWGMTGQVRTHRPLDRLFDKVASGAMGRRRRRKDPNLAADRRYRRRLADMLAGVADETRPAGSAVN